MASVRARLVRVAGVVVALGLVLGGCAGQPGAAAVVDGEAITEATLAATVEDLSAISELPPVTVLQELIISPFLIEAAAEAGFGASEDEARAFLDDAAAGAGLDPADLEFGPGAILLGQRFAAQGKAQAAGRVTDVEAVATALIEAADVEVSPRYGQWEDLGITYISRPWLVGASASAS